MMKKKNLKKLSFSKKAISNLESSRISGGGPSNGTPCASVQTLETCESLGPQCGGLTFDAACSSRACPE